MSEQNWNLAMPQENNPIWQCHRRTMGFGNAPEEQWDLAMPQQNNTQYHFHPYRMFLQDILLTNQGTIPFIFLHKSF